MEGNFHHNNAVADESKRLIFFHPRATRLLLICALDGQNKGAPTLPSDGSTLNSQVDAYSVEKRAAGAHLL